VGSGFSNINFFGLRSPASGGLAGTFYDLKQTPGKKRTSIHAGNYMGVVKNFIQSGFRDSVLNDYFKAPEKLYATQFYIPWMRAEEAPKAYGVEKDCEPAQWVAVYRGRVSPPKTGSYYFVGTADDIIVVRFGKKLVMDGSYSYPASDAPSTGSYPQPYAGNRRGLTKGDEIVVRAGEWYEMEVLIGERPGGSFHALLYVEEKGVTYKRNSAGQIELPLFRTAAGKLPPAGQRPPPVDEDGPVWRVQMAGRSSLLDGIR
jgi:hypothetical protein